MAALHQDAPGQTIGWKIHRPGSVLPSPAYCFVSVIVWTENKNVTISDRFICFILTVKRRWRPVFWGRQLKRSSTFFEDKECIRVTWLEDFLISKWPGSFTAPPPVAIWALCWLIRDVTHATHVTCARDMYCRRTKSMTESSDGQVPLHDHPPRG